MSKLKEDSDNLKKHQEEELQKIRSDFEDKSTAEAQLNLEVIFFPPLNAITEKKRIRHDAKKMFVLLFCILFLFLDAKTEAISHGGTEE